MESKFGVTLKSTGTGSPGNIRKNPPSKRTNTSGLKPANVGNLKAMFDGGETGKDSGVQKSATKAGITSGNRFGQDKFKSDDSKCFKDSDVTGSRSQKSLGSSTKGFEDYKFTIDLGGDEPQVAVAKVFAEDKKAFQSTVEKRVQTVDSESEVMDKDKAKSTLVEQLSLIRTRPGSAGKKDDRQPVLKSNSDVPSTESGGKTFLQKTNSGQDNKLNIQTKVTNTQPRKFVSTSKSLESSSKLDQDSVTSPTRVTKTAGFTNTRTSNVTQNKPIEFGLSFTKKTDVDKDKNTVSHNRQSSSDSSGSFSPRSSIVSNRSQSSYVSRQNSSGSDKNVGSSLMGNLSPRSNSPSSTISSISSTKFDFNSSSSVNYQRQSSSSPRLSRKNVEDVKPEWLDKSKQLVNQFQTKLKKPEHSETSRTTVSKTETKTVTQTRLRNSANSNGIGKDNTRKSAELGTSYLKKSDGPRHFNKTHSLDNETVLSRIQKQGPSRKISSDQFQKIKGGFEQIGSGSSEKSVIKTADKPKPKFEIHTTKKLLERKHSFEMQKPDNIPKNVTLKVLRETGKVPKVKDFVQALNAGRQRSASTGSINNKFNMSDDIYEAVDGEEYNDAISQDWPATDSGTDSEAIYEYIAEPDAEGRFDNQIQLSKDGQLKYRVPTRRYGQKSESLKGHYWRGVNRPTLSLEEDEGILPDHSSSGFTTEGSSKEGTMESVDDRAGIDADIEYDSDSSNSGIYEPINPDFTHVRDDDGDTGNDTPPELPAERTKKKKKDKDGKSTGQKIGSKLKQFYKSKITSNQEPAGLHKVSSAPVVNTTTTTSSSSSSAGVLNKIGGKLKLIKRTKSAEPSTLLEEEVVISSSDYEGSDTNDNPGLEESGPIMMKPAFADIEYADSSSSSELISNEGTDHQQQPAYANDSAQNGEPNAPPPLPPPLPPRISGNFSSQPDGRTSPPLPPRNRISQNVNLDTVVPISPGLVSAAHSTGDLRKGTLHLSRDSYLHGHNYKASSETNIHGDFPRGETTTDDSPPPVPSLPVPSLPPKRNAKDDSDGVKLREKEPLSQRLSSGNSPNDPDRNSILPPFEHMWKFKSHFEEEDIYIDLNNDSDLYGQLDRRYTTKFESEPLYQIYNKDKITRDSHRHTVQTHSDDESDYVLPFGDERIYEAVDEMFEKVKAGLDVDSKTDNTSPSKTVSTLELFGKTGSVLRALWSEMPEVKESGILETILPQERKIQEAMFEIITSEASYLKSVNVLIDVFLMSQEFSSEHSDRCVISRQERHVLFSNIGAVRESSEQFLMDLEARWQQSVQLSDVCDIIYRHAAKKFDCYVRYCSNQTFQDRATQELMKKTEFSDVVRRLERTPECQGLPMISFLLLPMQRITRLPLLVDAICHRLEPATDRHKSATRALDALNRVVKKCNDGAKRMQQTEQMCHLVQNLEFKVKEIPLISASRHLVKQGELTRIATDTSSKLPFGRGKPSKHSVHVYLFNDLILFSKKKSSNQYVVIDYAPRNALHVEVIDTSEAKAKLLPQGVPSGCKNIFLVAMLENHEQKQVEMVLSCKSPSERARWVDALTPVTKNDDNEKIYEEWDCPQVHCIQKYIATEPDELALEESDVINVFKKMADGWYEGERIRDGERGWFPSENTEEIVNSHVRAKNLRLRYRLLLASQDYASTYSKA